VNDSVAVAVVNTFEDLLNAVRSVRLAVELTRYYVFKQFPASMGTSMGTRRRAPAPVLEDKKRGMVSAGRFSTILGRTGKLSYYKRNPDIKYLYFYIIFLRLVIALIFSGPSP
jgi:hypothetical protein